MRTLAAALAVRAGSTRLYAKPLQNLADGVTILGQIVAQFRGIPAVDRIVVGVAEGRENFAFRDAADRLGVAHIVGSEADVVSRLIGCGRAAGASDVLRITTENPFRWFEPLESLWRKHLADENHLTVTQRVPYGTNVEIYTLSVLEHSHAAGERYREHASAYIREHRTSFKVGWIDGEGPVRRPDLRLSVDNPEDLVLARAVYAALAERAPMIPLAEIVAFLDGRPDLKALVAPYAQPSTPWT